VYTVCGVYHRYIVCIPFLSLSCSYHAQSLRMCTLGLAVVSIVLPCNPLSEPPLISTLVAAVVSNESKKGEHSAEMLFYLRMSRLMQLERDMQLYHVDGTLHKE